MLKFKTGTLLLKEDPYGRKRNFISVECEQCHKNFFSRLSRSGNRGAQRFCSLDCSAINRSSVLRKVLKCSFCNKEFSILLSDIKLSNSGLHFCSRPCKDEAQKIKYGNTAMWPSHFGLGDKTDYRKENKHLLEYGCTDCQEKRTWLLHFHHIDGNRKNNLGTNIELVCVHDHLKRHLKKTEDGWKVDFRCLTPRDLLKDL